ncbi:MAG: YitT family protein [Ruminococcus sp.]|nr:YitT family protein [Ruminococcus sp.]
MQKHKHIELFKDIAVDIFAGLFIALGVYNLASSANFPMVGINGIALILYKLFGLPIGTVAFLLNIPITLFTFRILGRKFFIKSAKTIVITSFMMDVVAPFFPLYHGDRWLAALCCGILSGLGYAMIYMRDSSTGGADFITLSIRAKHPHWSIGNISFIMDVVIVLLGTLLVSRDVDSLLYGIVVSYLLSYVVDKIMYGIDKGKVTLIVTEHGQDICNQIDLILGRGSTILKGMGSYTKSEKDVVMCACNNKQMYSVRKLIKEVDPKAFLVIMESSEVIGEGFKSE